MFRRRRSFSPRPLTRQSGNDYMKSRRTRAFRMMFNALAFGMSLAFFAAFAHHVYRFDFKPMAGLGVPILVLFFGFASLFFIRGRSLAKGSAQFRGRLASLRNHARHCSSFLADAHRGRGGGQPGLARSRGCCCFWRLMPSCRSRLWTSSLRLKSGSLRTPLPPMTLMRTAAATLGTPSPPRGHR